VYDLFSHINGTFSQRKTKKKKQSPTDYVDGWVFERQTKPQAEKYKFENQR
jgi:hypothetical protein